MKKKVVLILLFAILFLTGCSDKMVGEVDRSKKLSSDEVESFILKDLEKKYNTKFTLELLHKNQISNCGYNLDGSCFYYEYIKDAYSYSFKGYDSNDMEFYVSYTDPYTNTKNNKYFEAKYVESYGISKKHVEYQNEFNDYIDSLMKKNNLSYNLYIRHDHDTVTTTLFDFYYYRLTVNTSAFNISNIHDDITSYINEFYSEYERDFDEASLDFDFDIYVTEDSELFNRISNYDTKEYPYYIMKSLGYKYESIVEDNKGFDKNLCESNKSTDETYGGRKKIILHYIGISDSIEEKYSIYKVYK